VTSAVTSAYPLLAVPVSCLFLGESFHLSLLFAAALIGGGLYLVAPREDGTEALRNRTGLFSPSRPWSAGLRGSSPASVGKRSSRGRDRMVAALGVAGVSWLVFLLREGRFGAGCAAPRIAGSPRLCRALDCGAGALSLTVGNLLSREASRPSPPWSPRTSFPYDLSSPLSSERCCSVSA
jgi:hypothetical protein